MGGEFDVHDEGIRFWHPGGPLHSLALETDVHPGFMTDWQQPLAVALTQATGLSILHETVYENRFGFTEALVSMGAVIQLYPECLGATPCRFGQRNFLHSAVISGPGVTPSAGCTTALISSPQSGCGMPKTATSPTAGWQASSDSISAG